jgi:multidrug efflux pump subunit AcrA (membrane-fusion protein)
MKKLFWIAFLALTVTLASCTGTPTATPPFDTLRTPPPAAPTVDSASSGLTLADGVVASAEAQPAHETQMSFTISAPVKEVLVKNGDVVTSGQALMTLYTPDLEGEITRAELAAKAGELEYQYWLPHRFDRPPERQWQAEAEWNQQIMALEVARASFAQSTIYAPFDATVVDVNIQFGEVAQTGQVVITLADLAHLKIKTTDLSERDVPAVQIGQTANVYVEALDVTVTGKVVKVSPISETVGGDVVYPVTIELDEQPEGLLWGMSAEVEIAIK